MSGHNYLKQKLYEAVLALAGDGEIDNCLTFAAVYFVHMQDRDTRAIQREVFSDQDRAVIDPTFVD